MPYEVRGGVALHASEIWPFVQDMQRLELAAFGTALHQFRAELKGCKLLDKDRFRWAAQDSPMSDEERRKHCRGFLRKIAVSCRRRGHSYVCLGNSWSSSVLATREPPGR